MILIGLAILLILLIFVINTAVEHDKIIIGLCTLIIFVTITAVFVLGTVNLGINLINYAKDQYAAQLEYNTATTWSEKLDFNTKVIQSRTYHSLWLRHIFVSDAYNDFELLPLENKETNNEVQEASSSN